MSETEYSQDNLAAIRTHLNNLEQMVRFNTATNPNVKLAVQDLFKSRPGLAELYLTLEGDPKTQADLVTALRVNQSTVSRTIKVLIDNGLVTPIPSAGGRHQVYMRSGVEPLIGVSKIARGHVASAVQVTGSKRESKQIEFHDETVTQDQGKSPKGLSIPLEIPQPEA